MGVQQVEACTLAYKVDTALPDSTFNCMSRGIDTFLALMLAVCASQVDTYAPMVAFISLDIDCV